MFEGFARLHDICISVNNQLYVMDCVDEVYFFLSVTDITINVVTPLNPLSL
jgi:hypothetical protein